MDQKVVIKWSPVLESIFSIKNKILLSHICNYCEWFSLNNDNTYLANELPGLLYDMKVIIESYDFRVKILGKYYNRLTETTEYKLEDGTFINDKSVSSYELSNNDILTIFGKEYLKYYDLSSYRDLMLNGVIKE